MAYCSYVDVIAEFKSLDTSSTGAVITNGKITSLIAQSDAFINGRVGKVYTTPVTGTEALLILKKISIGLTAERISNILKLKGPVPEGNQLMQKDLIKEAREDLSMIVKGDLLLIDAAKISSTGGVASYTGENDVRRTFKQGEDQW